MRFYKRDFGGVDWPAESAARRDAAIARPTEREFYIALNETLDLLGDRHTNAVTPTRPRGPRGRAARLARRPAEW